MSNLSLKLEQKAKILQVQRLTIKLLALHGQDLTDFLQEQVTDKIEKKLQDTPNLDYIKSYSRPGQSVIYVYLDDKAPRDSIRSTWHEVRNLTEDMKRDLPEGVYGPYYNDRFDDVYGSIYAVTGDG